MRTAVAFIFLILAVFSWIWLDRWLAPTFLAMVSGYLFYPQLADTVLGDLLPVAANARQVAPQEIRAYRQANPGSTMADAVIALKVDR